MKETVANIFRQNTFLRILAYFSTGCLIVAIAGLFIDQRILSGSPIWLKPFKFAVSVGIYSVTLLWFQTFLSKDKNLSRASNISAIMLALELFIVFLQAYRGKLSHFNNFTIEDGILFSVMGAGITIVWVFLFVFLKRFYTLYRTQKNPVVLAILCGILISSIFMPLGFYMTKPTPEQEKEIIRRGGNPIGMQLGSHSVRASDNDPGIPVTGWSKTGGDLRISHFIGIHAMQIIPLFGFLLIRWKRFSNRMLQSVIALFAIAYFVISFATFILAINGIPLLKI